MLQLVLTTMRLGVTSSGRAPSTGVAGALPLLHAFSYEVSETGQKAVKLVGVRQKFV